MSNPNSDVRILQQLYGDDQMHRHVEDWRMKRSLDSAAYCDFYRDGLARPSLNAERDGQRRTYGTSDYDYGEKLERIWK